MFSISMNFTLNLHEDYMYVYLFHNKFETVYNIMHLKLKMAKFQHLIPIYCILER